MLGRRLAVTDDIVTRLKAECWCDMDCCPADLCEPCQAADEIERLRAIIDTMARMDRPVSLATAVVLALKSEATDAE
jgi:hypothetical protein